MISIANSRIAAAEFGSVRGINAPVVTENTVLKRSQLKRSPAGYAIRKCAVKQARQGTRGTARSRLLARSAFGKCRASSRSAGVSVMRMHLEAG